MTANRAPRLSTAAGSQPARRCASLLITGGLLLSTGACAMPGRPASTDALTDQSQVDARPDHPGAGAAAPDRNVHHAVVADPPQREQIIQPLSHEVEQSEAVDAPAGEAPGDGTAIRHAPEPRVELASYRQPCNPCDPI